MIKSKILFVPDTLWGSDSGHRSAQKVEFPDYVQGMQKGKRRLLKLESIRNDQLTMQDILSEDKEILNWWNSIDAG